LPKKVTLKDEKILDRWSVLIEGAQGRGNELINRAAELVKQFSAPGLNIEDAEVFSSLFDKFLSGIFKKSERKHYLMITNDKLKDINIFLGAQDYGKNLYVSWYLTVEPGIWKEISSSITKEKGETFKWVPVLDNVFLEEELDAYATFVHHCLLRSVEELMLRLGQDFSRVDRKSKGFLGVS
jgi:hypothetical protein